MSEASHMRQVTVDQNGRPLGPRALDTRNRLLQATVDLLDQKSVRDVAVVDIARNSDTSPATFYQYFKDVSEAILRLAERAAEEMPVMLDLIERPWHGSAGLDTARALSDAFIQHWDAHRAVLLVRNLAADEGDRNFQKVRREALRPVLDQLAQKIEESKLAGQVGSEVHAYAAAAALAAILERLAAYHVELEPLGVTRGDLVETCARIIYQTVTGDFAPVQNALGKEKS
ncbi:MAG: TetR/AcrR family transcriptional regulator [Myxococcota bacterium]